MWKENSGDEADRSQIMKTFVCYFNKIYFHFFKVQTSITEVYVITKDVTIEI